MSKMQSTLLSWCGNNVDIRGGSRLVQTMLMHPSENCELFFRELPKPLFYSYVTVDFSPLSDASTAGCGRSHRLMHHAFANLLWRQPRSQGLRGETVTKTLVKFVLLFQNFGKKIACAVRHNRIQLYCNQWLQYGCVALRMWFFSQNFGTIKWILPGSSSPSHREGPGTEVAVT